MSSFAALLALGLTVAPAAAGSATGASSSPPDSTGSVRGVVYAVHGEEARALERAVVELRTGHGTENAVTGSGGRYELEGIAPGPALLRVRHLGYEDLTLDVEILPGVALTVDVDLERRPLALRPMEVTGMRPRRAGAVTPAAGATPRRAELDALAAEGGIGGAGLAQAARGFPGEEAERPGEVLLMRGSTTEQRLVLLDGAPVYSPFHLAGLVPSFQGDLLGETSVFVGGAPSRYDGGLSQVLDLETRSPRADRFRLSGGLDGMSARLVAEGPLGPSTRFLAGGRLLHDLQPRALDQGRSPYGYMDGLARVEERFGSAHRLTATVFWNRESVRLDPEVARQTIEARGPLGSSVSPGEAVWGNRALSVRYAGAVGETGVQAGVGWSGYQAALPLDLVQPVFIEGWLNRTRASVDLARGLGEWDVRAGGSVEGTLQAFSAHGMDGGGGPPQEVETDGATAGAYLEGRRPLGSEFALTLGGRLDGFSGERVPRVAPRASLEWALSDDALLTVTAARYHQFVPAGGDAAAMAALANPGDPGSGSTWVPRLAVASSSHLVVGMDQELTPGLALGITGFAKRFHGLPGMVDERLNSSGLDLRVARDGERLRGWLGYTLSWLWSGGETRTGDFTGRQLLAAGVEGELAGWAGVRISTVYGGGIPFTGIPLVGSDIETFASPPRVGGAQLMGATADADDAPPLAVAPVDDFLRLDLEVEGRWEIELGGRTAHLRPYVRVLNALNRRDALFLYFDEWRDEDARPLASRPLLPLVGVEFRF